MKTTLKRALDTAAEFSRQAKTTPIYVMDKANKQTEIAATTYTYKRLIADGYFTAAVFVGGVRK